MFEVASIILNWNQSEMTINLIKQFLKYEGNVTDISVVDNNSTAEEENKPLGTGGAIFNAWDKVENEFILLNGDTFFDIQYEILFDFIKEKNVESLIVLRFSEDISRYGFVEIDENYKITNFIEKGELPENRIDGYINGGIYYFKKIF